MALAYVLDENLRGPLWTLVIHHNQRGADRIDVVRLGDLGAPPLGTKDPELLRWSEDAGRILVSSDKRTMPGHLAAHLAAGRRSPGVMMLRPGASLRAVLEFLVLAAHATEPSEWADAVWYVP